MKSKEFTFCMIIFWLLSWSCWADKNDSEFSKREAKFIVTGSGKSDNKGSEDERIKQARMSARLDAKNRLAEEIFSGVKEGDFEYYRSAIENFALPYIETSESEPQWLEEDKQTCRVEVTLRVPVSVIKAIKRSGVSIVTDSLDEAVDKLIDSLIPFKEPQRRVAIGEIRIAGKLNEDIIWDIREKLVKRNLFIVITDRERLKQLWEYIKEGNKDFYDRQTRQEFGKTQQADLLLFGRVREDGKVWKVYLDLEEVDTGKVVWMNSAYIIPRKSRLWGSVLSILPGFGIGHFYNQSKRSGIFYLVVEGLAIYGTVIAHQRYKVPYDKYLAATDVDDIERYYDESRNPYRVRNLLLPTVLAISAIHASYDAQTFKRPYLPVKAYSAQNLRIETSNGRLCLTYRRMF